MSCENETGPESWIGADSQAVVVVDVDVGVQTVLTALAQIFVLARRVGQSDAAAQPGANA
ncbi:hypothetical protein Acsp02_41060 [Actinoplanes sp. NBRC 103695]|nr:hypothetical protein Acsp02_41060 [Actinoplanes sp. NBRC 103695]